MGRRWAFVIGTALLLTGLLAAVILSSAGASLPKEAEEMLDRYLAARFPTAEVVQVTAARWPERLSQSMSQPLVLDGDATSVDSPELYAGEVVRPPSAGGEWPLPPQAAWCVWPANWSIVSREALVIVVTQHEQLYGEQWGLFQIDQEAAAEIGCPTSS